MLDNGTLSNPRSWMPLPLPIILLLTGSAILIKFGAKIRRRAQSSVTEQALCFVGMLAQYARRLARTIACNSGLCRG
jgi:hypothetical protein